MSAHGSGDAAAPVLDRTALDTLRRLGGEDLVGRMIDLFVQNVPERVRAASTGLAQGDLRAVERAAHSLKSTAANLGAARLRAAAELLEHAAADRQESVLPELVDALERAAPEAERALLEERKGKRS